MTDGISVDEYRRLQAEAMLERGRDGLQNRVRSKMLGYGWTFFHTFDSRKSAPGFPDIIALREFDGAMFQLVVELKREGQWPTPDQRAWLDAFSRLDKAASETHLWFPRHLLDGTIDDVLQGGYSHRTLWTTQRAERKDRRR